MAYASPIGLFAEPETLASTSWSILVLEPEATRCRFSVVIRSLVTTQGAPVREGGEERGKEGQRARGEQAESERQIREGRSIRSACVSWFRAARALCSRTNHNFIDILAAEHIHHSFMQIHDGVITPFV